MRLLRIPLLSLTVVLAVLGAACGEDPDAPATYDRGAYDRGADDHGGTHDTEPAPAVEEPSVFRVAFIACSGTHRRSLVHSRCWTP